MHANTHKYTHGITVSMTSNINLISMCVCVCLFLSLVLYPHVYFSLFLGYVCRSCSHKSESTEQGVQQGGISMKKSVKVSYIHLNVCTLSLLYGGSLYQGSFRYFIYFTRHKTMRKMLSECIFQRPPPSSKYVGGPGLVPIE